MLSHAHIRSVLTAQAPMTQLDLTRILARLQVRLAGLAQARRSLTCFSQPHTLVRTHHGGPAGFSTSLFSASICREQPPRLEAACRIQAKLVEKRGF